MNNFRRSLSIFSMIFLSIFAFLSLILGWLAHPMGQSGLIIFLGLYCCAFVPIAWLSSGWLVWAGRERISSTLIWAMFQLVFILSLAMYTSSFFGMLFSSLLIILSLLLGFIDFLYAYKNGFALRLIALGSIGFIWSILFAWRITGNLLDVWIETLATGSNNLWWLHGLMYGFGWMVMAGIASSGIEAFNVLSKELKAS